MFLYDDHIKSNLNMSEFYFHHSLALMLGMPVCSSVFLSEVAELIYVQKSPSSNEPNQIRVIHIRIDKPFHYQLQPLQTLIYLT